ncbi:MAG: ATP-binding cassette domain-containing protein, partial [Sarcina sp.]
VLENITFSLVVKKINKKEIAEKAKYIGQKLHIWNLRNRYPNELSGGEMQRVSMARALCANSSLILMDEPFSSLDKNLKIEMCKVIKEINKDFNTTFIVVSHDIEESLSISDSIAILGEKKILQKDTPKNIYYFPLNKYVGNFLGKANYIKGEVIDGKYFKCILGKFLLEDKRIIDKKYLCVRPSEVIIKKEIFHENKKCYSNKFLISHIESGYKSSMITLIKGKEKIVIEYNGDEELNIGQVIWVKLKNER